MLLPLRAAAATAHSAPAHLVSCVKHGTPIALHRFQLDFAEVSPSFRDELRCCRELPTRAALRRVPEVPRCAVGATICSPSPADAPAAYTAARCQRHGNRCSRGPASAPLPLCPLLPPLSTALRPAAARGGVAWRSARPARPSLVARGAGEDAVKGWLDLASFVSSAGGSGGRTPYDELADKIGREVYMDLQGWHL